MVIQFHTFHGSMPVVRAIFITLLQSIQIQVTRSIILVTMPTDTQIDMQKHHLHQKKFQEFSTLEGVPLWLHLT